MGLEWIVWEGKVEYWNELCCVVLECIVVNWNGMECVGMEWNGLG